MAYARQPPLRVLLILLSLAGSVGCGPLPDSRNPFSGDLQSPIFLGTRAQSPLIVEITFQEAVKPDVGAYTCLPDVPIRSISAQSSVVQVEFAQPMVPGLPYALFGRVLDLSGNSMKFITKLYGFNPAVPELRINEFTTRGSGKHPDCVELYVESAGNLAGVTVYEGTAEEWTDRIVLPETVVAEGEYVVVHFKPTGLPGEVDEVEDSAQSAGYDTSSTAWDFWVFGGNGLSGNNGTITVCESPGGAILDAVLYSNRKSTSDDRYDGFGSRQVLAQAQFLAYSNEWSPSDGPVRPEDGVNPDGSTGTRSICRREGADTNSKKDWYIVPTRGATFGGKNTLKEYTP